MDKSNVAVLLDYENVGGRDAIRRLLDRISGIGKIVEKRAYGDWSVPSGKVQDQLYQLGFSVIHQRHSASGKNSSDIKLSIDAMDLVLGPLVSSSMPSDRKLSPEPRQLAARAVLCRAGTDATKTRRLDPRADRLAASVRHQPAVLLERIAVGQPGSAHAGPGIHVKSRARIDRNLRLGNAGCYGVPALTASPAGCGS